MNAEFIEAIHQLARERSIDVSILFEAIETALVSAYKKNFGGSGNVRVQIDRETGDMQVYALKHVVEEVTQVNEEILLEDAKSIHPTLQEIGRASCRETV